MWFGEETWGSEILCFSIDLILTIKYESTLIFLNCSFFMHTMETEKQGKENPPNVMKVPASPSFLKPKAISLRKKVDQIKSNSPLVEVDVNKNDTIPFLSKSPKTARNPFRRNECKRKRETESTDEDSNSLLWRHVNRSSSSSSDNTNMRNLPSPFLPSLLDECALSAFSDVNAANLKLKLKHEKNLSKPLFDLPMDWTIYKKMRFTSFVPFPTKGSFRTFEEVNGTIGFVRCLHSGETKKSDVHSSHGAKVFQHCLVWMHPYLPWLNLFPRDDNHMGNGSSFITPAIQEALHSKWSDSLRSLYQQVRLYQCPFFYMCTPTFTALFRCAGAAAIPVVHALISSTTKGFRKALREEGIKFTMPLCKDSNPSLEETTDEDLSTLSPPSPIEKEDELGEKAEDDEPESWLESLGVSQEDFINKKIRQKDLEFYIDNKEESLVYVEDLETQALVNFLLNSNFCTSKTGPMAGVPPTLLAPTSFLGGTLQPLQLRHSTVKRNGKEEYSMEVTGPILPNSRHSLTALFENTQEKELTIYSACHFPTTVFSKVRPQSPTLPCIFAESNMADCGLPKPFVQEMCRKRGDF